MQNIQHYFVAKTNIRSDQRKMLHLMTEINKAEIREFCLRSLIKDGVLKKDSAYCELTIEDLLGTH